MKHRIRKLTSGCSLALIASCMAGSAAADASSATASVVLDQTHQTGGAIPERFMGVSVEWTLIERYMNPNAQPAFVNLLGNLNSGFIRVGGGSQDSTPYSADAPNTDSIITNADFAYLRTTIDALNSKPHFDAAPPWGVVLGSAMTPTSSPANTQKFVQGIATVFAGDESSVAGISLGNEPDQDGYGTTFPSRYLTDFATYSDPAVSGNWPIVVPSTSTDIVPWETLADQAHPSRWFWSWPQILDTVAPTVKARAGVFGPWVSDHFYPFARNCSTQQPWRCATIPLLLGKDHLNALDFLVYTHGTMAMQHGLPYRLEETNTGARQGIVGVSDVAASATYALDMMFHVACPQPPNLPGANADCSVGGVGMNLQNAARNGNTHPEDGNAFYNVIYFDSSPAMGPPVPAPEYYGALFFAQLAQGTTGLRPVAASGQDAARVSAWRVEAGAGERRLFVINKSDSPLTTNVSSAASRMLVHRMSSFDPTGTGKTVDAASMQIDGRQVAADGSWPGFAPTSLSLQGGATDLALGPGEAVALIEYPQVALQMVPSIVNLRSTAGLVTVVLTAANGDLSFWNLKNLHLQGGAPVSVAESSDGRTVVAAFSKAALQTLPAGDVVSVSLTGDIERDGVAAPFTSNTTVRVIR
jgi:hypothetical protein